MSFLYYDSETTGLDPLQDRITLFQLYDGERIKLAVPGAEFIAKLKTRFKDNVICGHNLKFDLKFLEHSYGISPPHIFDTYLAEVLISGGQNADKKGSSTLEAVAKKYTGVDLIKDEKLVTSFRGGKLTQEQIQYASMDVALLPEIQRKQSRQLIELGLEEVFKTEMECLPAVVWLELSGIKIDVSALGKLTEETKTALENSDQSIRRSLKVGGYKGNYDFSGLPVINFNSHPQVLRALRSLGLDVQSTGDDVLAKLNHPVADALRQYRSQDKLLGSFLEKYPKHVHPVTGRLHASFKQYGTATGRFSCVEPNLQQTPKDKAVRNLFVSSKGYKLVVADYSQIELRIMGEISREPKFVETYKNNGDLHTQTAAIVLGKPISEITKSERQEAKAVNFGFLYGMSAETFKTKAKKDYNVDFSFEDASKIRGLFFEAYPVLEAYLERIGKTACNNQKIRNLAGRVVKFDQGLYFGDYERLGRNAPIQSLNADILKTAMASLYLKFRGKDVKLVNAIHDELVFEVSDNYVEEARKIVTDEMEAAGRKYLKTVPCKVEVVVGATWQK